MSGVKVVGLLGAMGAGKSTVADHLTERHGYHRLRLADPIKDMMLPLGLGYEELYGSRKQTPLEHLGGKTSRFAQQTLGTEWGRATISQDIWVLQLARRIDALVSSSTAVTKVVVDDVRFPNEAQLLRARYGARLYTVRRPEVEFAEWRQQTLRRIGWWVGGPLGIHESERGWATIRPDGELFNVGSVELLRQLADYVGEGVL